MDPISSNDQGPDQGRRWTKMWTVLKILFVVVCVSAFGWRAIESFLGYLRGDVGTKVELLRQNVKDYPRIAACRHPNQLVNFWFDYHTNLYTDYGINYTYEMSNLEAYEKIEGSGSTYYEALKKFFSNNTKAVSDIEIMKWGRYDDPLWPSYASQPPEDNSISEDWKIIYHPLYGTCIEFVYSDKIVQKIGQDGISSAEIRVNFEEAFPPRPPDPDPPIDNDFIFFCPGINGTNETCFGNPAWHELELSNGESILVFLIYKARQMISSTHQLVSLNDDKHKYLNLEEATTDRTEISDKVGCQPDPDYNEDDCLLRCLITQTSDELDCLHPRLALLEQAKDCKMKDKICGRSDLLEPTIEYYRQMSKDRAEFGLFPFMKNDTDEEDFVSFLDEVGLRMIKDRLAMYSVVSVETEDLKDNIEEVNRERCGCKVPCKGHSVKIRPVKDEEAYRRSWVFIYFQFERYIQAYTYYYLYTFGDFVADFGGLSGLFLGMSALSFANIFADLMLTRCGMNKVDERKHKRGKKHRKDSVTISIEPASNQLSPARY